MRWRSLLYVPAHVQRFLAKAASAGADAVILDLEDAVPEEAKSAARDGLPMAVASSRREGAGVLVRINAGPRARDDALAAVEAGADGLVVPKVSSPEDAEAIAGWVTADSRGASPRPLRLGLVALLESAASLERAGAIARSTHVTALALGSEDLALELGASPVPEVLRVPKLLVHYAAKGAGKVSLGLLRSVADTRDTEGLEAAAREARLHGFDGATCIHPVAVPIFNVAFDWSEAERDWARRVLAAGKSATGPFVVDGRMVDAPVLARARRIAAGHAG